MSAVWRRRRLGGGVAWWLFVNWAGVLREILNVFSIEMTIERGEKNGVTP